MLKNYISIALRSFRKNYVYSLINIIGMAFGLAGVIVTILLFEYEHGFDKVHTKSSSLFRVNSLRATTDETQKWGVVPNALGPAVAGEQENVVTFCRYSFNHSFLVQYDDIIHREVIAFADPDFFDLFSFTVASGNTGSFRNKNSAIITHDFAVKYFGDEDPVGKELTLRRNNEIFNRYVVGAVLGKIAKNSSFQFDIILQHENLLDAMGSNDNDWNSEVQTVLYLQLKGQKDEEITFPKVLDKYVDLHNNVQESRKLVAFYLTPFNKQTKELRELYAYTTSGSLPISALYGSVIMNTLILLIACFNFTNTFLVYTNKRLREIGIRRTFGGYKWQIFKQFFVESFLLCFLALLLSVEISNWWVSLLNRQWPVEIPVYAFDSLATTVYLTILLLVVSVIAGAYPAYYASKFQPTEILTRKVKFVGSNNLSRVLITWQFAFSIMAIFSGIVLTQNAQYQKTLDWGFDKDNAIIIPLTGEANFRTIRDALLKYEQIDRIAGSVQNLGYSAARAIIEIDGIAHDARMLLVGDNYLSAIGCKISAGRTFHEGSTFDIENSVLVNEKFVQTFNIQNPTSKVIFRDGKNYQIVGVVKDFMPFGLFDPVFPVMIHAAPEEMYENLVFTSTTSELSGLMSAAKNEWQKLFPNQPFEGFYMSSNAAQAYQTNLGIMIQFLINAVFALFLSIAGLYSLVALNINKRVKEIGIRKVFGASVAQIIHVLNKEYVFILSIAIFIGCIGGYYFMNRFLSDIFAQHLKIGPVSFVISALLILLMTAVTSGIKITKAAMQNPADSLRTE
jgi:putative ABC transport system permease protein